MQDAVDDNLFAVAVLAARATAAGSFDLDCLRDRLRVAESAELVSVQVVNVGKELLPFIGIESGDRRLHYSQ
jgi:hypothetical protein